MQECLEKQDWPVNEFSKGKRMTGGQFQIHPEVPRALGLVYSLCMPLINADDVTKVVGVTI